MIEKLKYFNDPSFKFDPESHKYTYLNESGEISQVFESVSEFISQFKKPFDKNISRYVAKSRGVSQQQILNEWAATAKEGTDLGTYVHEWIEDFYNGKNPDLPVVVEEKEDPFFVDIEVATLPTFQEKALDRVQKFKKLYDTKLNMFDPKAQELRIFSKKWGIAGTLDALFYLDTKYYIGDWKTNKDFTDDDHKKGRRQRMLYPFEDLWDNNLNGYSLQLSTYRLILEEEVGFDIAGSFLAWIGTKEPTMYKVIDLRDRLKDFLNKNYLQ